MEGLRVFWVIVVWPIEHSVLWKQHLEEKISHTLGSGVDRSSSLKKIGISLHTYELMKLQSSQSTYEITINHQYKYNTNVQKQSFQCWTTKIHTVILANVWLMPRCQGTCRELYVKRYCRYLPYWQPWKYKTASADPNWIENFGLRRCHLFHLLPQEEGVCFRQEYPLKLFVTLTEFNYFSFYTILFDVRALVNRTSVSRHTISWWRNPFESYLPIL